MEKEEAKRVSTWKRDFWTFLTEETSAMLRWVSKLQLENVKATIYGDKPTIFTNNEGSNLCTAHPKLHRFSWSLPPSINNMHASRHYNARCFIAPNESSARNWRRWLPGSKTETASRMVTTSQCRSHRHSSWNTDTLSRNTRSGYATEQLPITWICTSRDARRTRHARGIWPAPDTTKDFFYLLELRRTPQWTSSYPLGLVSASKVWAYIITQWIWLEVSLRLWRFHENPCSFGCAVHKLLPLLLVNIVGLSP